ncbi:hypothetical protein [Roseomonas chloroacetimidivorans]|uniref:hypothetical protein n=1 Tax=Roseomonas chloroacetimidivorans TaxID=1766656 RepID=UPI003C747A21
MFTGPIAVLQPLLAGFCQLSGPSCRHTPADAVGLGCGENGAGSCRSAEVKHATAVGGDMLIVTDVRAEVAAEFVVIAIERVS